MNNLTLLKSLRPFDEVKKALFLFDSWTEISKGLHVEYINVVDAKRRSTQLESKNRYPVKLKCFYNRGGFYAENISNAEQRFCGFFVQNELKDLNLKNIDVILRGWMQECKKDLQGCGSNAKAVWMAFNSMTDLAQYNYHSHSSHVYGANFLARYNYYSHSSHVYGANFHQKFHLDDLARNLETILLDFVREYSVVLIDNFGDEIIEFKKTHWYRGQKLMNRIKWEIDRPEREREIEELAEAKRKSAERKLNAYQNRTALVDDKLIPEYEKKFKRLDSLSDNELSILCYKYPMTHLAVMFRKSNTLIRKHYDARNIDRPNAGHFLKGKDTSGYKRKRATGMTDQRKIMAKKLRDKGLSHKVIIQELNTFDKKNKLSTNAYYNWHKQTKTV